MNIKILGADCPNCKQLEVVVKKVLERHGVEAHIEKVSNYNEMIQYPILSTPGLVINGKLVSAGRIPTEEEILSWLT